MGRERFLFVPFPRPVGPPCGSALWVRPVGPPCGSALWDTDLSGRKS
jgi:hypothetical protein